jgi:hypothetical protein
LDFVHHPNLFKTLCIRNWFYFPLQIYKTINESHFFGPLGREKVTAYAFSYTIDLDYVTFATKSIVAILVAEHRESIKFFWQVKPVSTKATFDFEPLCPHSYFSEDNNIMFYLGSRSP